MGQWVMPCGSRPAEPPPRHHGAGGLGLTAARRPSRRPHSRAAVVERSQSVPPRQLLLIGGRGSGALSAGAQRELCAGHAACPATASLPALPEIPPKFPPWMQDPSPCVVGFCPQRAAGGARAEGLLESGCGHQALNATPTSSSAGRAGAGDGAECQVHAEGPTANTHQVTPRAAPSAADETWETERGGESKSKFGKTSPTDLTASRWHEEGWRWLGLRPWE